jgi:hypothetical protein
MRISTAEIKVLIQECVSDGKTYTNMELIEYVSNNSDKEFSRAQISGAITQLIDRRDLVRVERGLYKKGNQSDELQDEGVVQPRDPYQVIITDMKSSLNKKMSAINPLELNEEQFAALKMLQKTIDECAELI